jgi:hypothetical protein
MDKVTQSNAASAEESASAAEELNAQALTLKEAVAELLLMVDGHSAYAGASVSPSAARPIQHTTVTSKVRTKATPRSLLTPAQAAKPAPTLAAAGGRKNGGIPLEGDLKDF